MNGTLLRALVALIPTGALLVGSILLFARGRSIWTFLQVLGSASLFIVVLTHLCQALQLFPGMGWGRENSPGHYVDLASMVVGLSLFPFGYLLQALPLSPGRR